MIGKTIRIFLADGEPTGILLGEISNWTGKVLVAPRSQLDQLSKREEVRRTGVYLLVGPDPDEPSRALASIGEGDNVFTRLRLRSRRRVCRPVRLLPCGHQKPEGSGRCDSREPGNETECGRGYAAPSHPSSVASQSS